MYFLVFIFCTVRPSNMQNDFKLFTHKHGGKNSSEQSKDYAVEESGADYSAYEEIPSYSPLKVAIAKWLNLIEINKINKIPYCKTNQECVDKGCWARYQHLYCQCMVTHCEQRRQGGSLVPHILYLAL